MNLEIFATVAEVAAALAGFSALVAAVSALLFGAALVSTFAALGLLGPYGAAAYPATPLMLLTASVAALGVFVVLLARGTLSPPRLPPAQ